MKKLLLLLLIPLGILSCTSDQEKAEKLIEDYMFKNVADYENYETIETSKIDSAYSCIFIDENARELGAKILHEEENYISSLMYSQLSLDDILEPEEHIQMDTSDNRLNHLKSLIAELEKLSNTFNSSFIGWNATHKSRYTTNEGLKIIVEDIYIFDKKLEKIIYHLTLNYEELELINLLDDISMHKGLEHLKKKVEDNPFLF